MTAPFLFGFIAFAFWHRYQVRERLAITRDTTLCLIEETFGSDMRVSYKANGQTIVNRSVSKPIGKTKGEKYKGIYHPEYPDELYILYYLPVFNATDFLITEGLITDMGNTSRKYHDNVNWIEFEYTVTGKLYERTQHIASGHHFTEGQKIKVYYHPQNPRMGYLAIP